MRYLPPKFFATVSFIATVAFALFLNWSPFSNAFFVYFMAGFMLIQVFYNEHIQFENLKKPELYLFALPSLFYVAGLFWSESPSFVDLKIALPILVFALVFNRFYQLDQKQFKTVLLYFIGSTTVCALVNFILYYSNSTPDTDIREMSLFMSHIRFSLFVNVAIFSAIYYIVWESNREHKKLHKFILWSGLFVLIPYVFIQQSLSGIISFVLYLSYILIQYTKKHNDRKKTLLFKSFFGLLYFGLLFLMVYELTQFLVVKDDVSNLPENTVNGNEYKHDLSAGMIENGHYVYINVCEKELKREWNKRSHYKYSGFDRKDQKLRTTLIRYLTSKGCTKDSVGVWKLTSDDIYMVENGETNYRFSSNINPANKIYTFYWEIHSALLGRNPSGHSAIQRLVFLHATTKLIQDNFWFGVGTTDLKKALVPYYKEINTGLDSRYWHGPHNQFFSFFAMFGFVGFSVIFIATIVLIIRTELFKRYFTSLFLVMVVLSMFVEDTLATQAGVVLYGYFGGLFLFGTKQKYYF